MVFREYKIMLFVLEQSVEIQPSLLEAHNVDLFHGCGCLLTAEVIALDWAPRVTLVDGTCSLSIVPIHAPLFTVQSL